MPFLYPGLRYSFMKPEVKVPFTSGPGDNYQQFITGYATNSVREGQECFALLAMTGFIFSSDLLERLPGIADDDRGLDAFPAGGHVGPQHDP
jgi:hypothetical protein